MTILPRLAVSGAVLQTGCNGITSACTTELRGTIQVTVSDARTGDPLAAGATVIVRRETFYDSVTIVSKDSTLKRAYQLFEDRTSSGDYDVTVRRSGYQEWRSTVTVVRNGCHYGPGPVVNALLIALP